ncbi:MAG: MFS transporter [Microbacteriaceae bacterium]
MTPLHNWYRAVLTLFAMLGLTNASLLARLPEVRESVNTTTAGIGFILLGFAIGSLAGLVIAGRLVERIGVKPIIVWGFVGSAIAVLGQSAAIAAGSSVALFIGFVVLGIVGSATDVAINVSGSALEQSMGKTIMPMLHAGFSVGTFVGVGIGTLGTIAGFSLVAQIAVLAIATSVVAILSARTIPHALETAKDTVSESTPAAPLWKNPLVLALGAGIFAITLAEGASNDWLVLSLVDDYGESRTNGAIAYGVLMVAMIATRVAGGRIADRLGRARTLQLFALIGAVGITFVILGGTLPVALVGSALWGAGVALGFPLFLSAAGEGENPARRVSFVASSGYMAFLVGPPVLGMIAQSMGLLSMFWIVAVCAVAAAVFARATGRAQPA